jgi:hypothetical protein
MNEVTPCTQCSELPCQCSIDYFAGAKEFLELLGTSQHSPLPKRKILDRKSRFAPGKSSPAPAALYLAIKADLAGPEAGVQAGKQAVSDMFTEVPPASSDELITFLPESDAVKSKLYKDEPWPIKGRIKVNHDYQRSSLAELGVVNAKDYKDKESELSTQNLLLPDEPDIQVNRIIQYNAAKFNRIVIGSGHKAFEMASIVYRSIGIEVIVVSRPEALDPELIKVATQVKLILNMDEREQFLRNSRTLGFASGHEPQ